MIVRPPDSSPEIFKLGHWERMVIAQALDAFANVGPQDDETDHMRLLARIFNEPDSIIQLVRERIE